MPNIENKFQVWIPVRNSKSAESAIATINDRIRFGSSVDVFEGTIEGKAAVCMSFSSYQSARNYATGEDKIGQAVRICERA